MKHRLATVLAAALLLVAFAGVAEGHTIKFPAGCFGNDNAWFYGEDNQAGSHPLMFCMAGLGAGNQLPDLSSFPTDNDPGNCAGLFGIDNGDFDECISSFIADVDGSHHLCLYTATNYGGNVIDVVGDADVNDLTATFDDNISSMRWRDDGLNC